MYGLVSRRVASLEASATLSVNDAAIELRKHGIDVIPLTVGEPDFPTPLNVTEAAVDAIEGGYTHYTPSYGLRDLREVIAEATRMDFRIPCAPNNVMVTIAKHAIYSGIMSVVDPGDEVIVADPSWVSYRPMVHLAGGKVVGVRVKEEEGFVLRAEAVAEALTPKSKMIILNSPSNPTGSVYPPEEIKGIADLARDHDLVVLSDEIYSRIIYDGHEHLSIAALPGMFRRTITINGVSKAYAMTGWRVGWAIAPLRLLFSMNKIQQHTITCAPSVAQRAAIEAIRGRQMHVKLMLREFKKRRDRAVELINEIPHFSCRRPEGTFYIFARYDLDIPSTRMAAYLLAEANVAVTPGVGFGPAGEGYIRISYATTLERMEEALYRVKKVIEGFRESTLQERAKNAMEMVNSMNTDPDLRWV